MPRLAKHDILKACLDDYLISLNELEYDPRKYQVRSVASALGISPTTLYKYEFDEVIRAGARRHKQDDSGANVAKREGESDQTIRDLRTALATAEERNKRLVAQLALLELNAALLGIDSEDLYRPPSKLR